jgi:hypothetical protein
MSDDLSQAFSQMTDQPGFDPMRMMSELMAGQVRFHSVFLAPFTPSFAAARKQYLTDGTGPLTGIADELKRQGAPDPEANARAMLAAAQAMAVVVIAPDHGIATIPQLFFGRLDADLRAQMVGACGTGFSGQEELQRALASLETQLATVTWPTLVAGPAWQGQAGSYWLELAAALLEGLDEGFDSIAAGGRERMADLAWWTAQGILTTHDGGQVDADDLELLVQVQLVAGEPAAAGGGIDALIRSGEADEELVIDLLNGFVSGAIRAGQAAEAGTWLAAHIGPWSAVLDGLYDLPLALFRLQAAAGAPAEALVATARLLAAADRKAARNDLTKEPIWEVTGEPGEVLDTAQAAAAIDRSTSFVAKKLEQKTIPWCRRGDQLRLPAGALAAWKAVMDDLGLLTG